MRTEFLTNRVSSLLSRFSPPRAIANNEEAKSDEVQIIMEAVNRFAPSKGYEDWWPKFERELLENHETRSWPLLSELKKAAGKIRGPQKHFTDITGDNAEFCPYKANAARMNNGQPVSEFYLYGREAVELKRRGLVQDDIFDRQKRSYYYHLEKVYGKQTADQMIAAREQMTQDALRVMREKGL